MNCKLLICLTLALAGCWSAASKARPVEVVIDADDYGLQPMTQAEFRELQLSLMGEYPEIIERAKAGDEQAVARLRESLQATAHFAEPEMIIRLVEKWYEYRLNELGTPIPQRQPQ